MYSYQPDHRPVALLAVTNALLVALIMIVGAITRLTESGLSITEWELFRGVVPPLDHSEWQSYFDMYKKSPEFIFANSFMTLTDFKSIFWWEYIHRLIGRLFVLTYALPLLVMFLYRKPWRSGNLWGMWRRNVRHQRPPLPYRYLLVTILFLGALQGFVGWWMVQSGLDARIDVDPIRLTFHLGIAWIIYALLLWIALPEHNIRRNIWVNVFAKSALVMITTTAMLGALTAGSKAGYANTDWPFFPNGSLIPEDYSLRLDSMISIQVTHRLAAYITALWLVGGSIFAWWKGYWTWSTVILIVAVLCQVALGIFTLINAVPITLAVLHQFVALMIASFLIVTIRRSA